MNASDTPILELLELAATRPGGDLLGPISLSVMPLACDCLTGPSGAGREDLVDVVSGRMPQRSGRIMFGGQGIDNADSISRMRNGLVRCRFDQQPPAGMSLREWLTLTRILLDRPTGYLWRHGLKRLGNADLSDLLAVLEFTGLREQADQYPEQLSRNQRRLTCLAGALMQRPKLLIVERPFVGLSADERQNWTERLLKLNADGMSLLLVDDCPSWLAQFCHHMTVMAQGRVIASGSPEVVGNDAAAIEAFTGRPQLS